ncbi:MAG: signal peptidase II [Candidatus Omnitrophica bacterium]|nr:signal peptidase II [Candidatus Omnitrophota bacterium]
MIRFVWIIPFVFFLDRIVKIWIIRQCREGEGFSVVPGVFHLTRVHNTGAAFGLLKGAPGFLIFFSLFSIFLFLVLLWRYGGGARRWAVQGFGSGLKIGAWALIIGGAMGNVYDRIRYGHVIDYLDFRVWPVFNLADVSICAGVSLLAWAMLRR